MSITLFYHSRTMMHVTNLHYTFPVTPMNSFNLRQLDQEKDEEQQELEVTKNSKGKGDNTIETFQEVAACVIQRTYRGYNIQKNLGC